MATAGDAPGPGPERAFAEDLPDTGEVTLDAEESLHLVRSRRAAVGDAVVLFDGRGGTRLARLLAADPRAARLLLEGPYPDREPARRVVVAASPPDPSRLDEMVLHLAELGVARWVPLLAARTAAGRGDLVPRRRDRLARLLREAAKVNGRSRLLEIGEPAGVAEVLRAAAGEGGAILLDPDPRAPCLADCLADCLPAGRPVPWLLVGPEGGFTPEERALAAAAGVPVARLLATALPTGTAALVAAAVALAAVERPDTPGDGVSGGSTTC